MLIRIENIKKSFKIHDSLFFKQAQSVLKGVSFDIFQGECLGIVGESGSGKSTLGKILLGVEKPDSGAVIFSDEMMALPKFKAVGVVFQDYNTSVNPRLTVKQIITEPLQRTDLSESQKHHLVETLLQEVGLSASMATRFPHQLSGGQLQRICIARAIAPNPKFILFDEAVSSLDVSIQVQVLDLLLEIKRRRNLSYLFITHDLAVATYVCDRLIFFNDGRVVEEISDLSKMNQVEHEYTKQLLDAAGYLELPLE